MTAAHVFGVCMVNIAHNTSQTGMKTFQRTLGFRLFLLHFSEQMKKLHVTCKFHISTTYMQGSSVRRVCNIAVWPLTDVLIQQYTVM